MTIGLPDCDRFIGGSQREVSENFQEAENMSLDPLNENPYQASYQATSNTNSGASVPDGDSDLKATMRSIGRWQLFFAILGFIGSGIMLLTTIGQMFLSMAMQGSLFGGRSQFIAGVIANTFLGAIVLLFCLLPSFLLFRASQKIRTFAATGAGSSREVFESQRTFWRYAGISISIIMSIYVLILMFVALFGFPGMFI